MTPQHVMFELVEAPDVYNPSFCTAIRAGCINQMNDIRRDLKEVNHRIDKIDNRMFTLIVLAIGQILAVAGTLGYFILSKVNLVNF